MHFLYLKMRLPDILISQSRFFNCFFNEAISLLGAIILDNIQKLRENDFAEIEKLFIANKKFDHYILTIDRVFDLDKTDNGK